MAAPYKPVPLPCLLDNVDENGAVRVADLWLAFRDFYLAPKAAGKLVEKPSARMARVEEFSEGEIQQPMLQMPFRKFAQRGFMDNGRDLARVRFAGALWKRLSGEDRERLRGWAEGHLDKYFSRAAQLDSLAPTTL